MPSELMWCVVGNQASGMDLTGRGQFRSHRSGLSEDANHWENGDLINGGEATKSFVFYF